MSVVSSWIEELSSSISPSQRRVLLYGAGVIASIAGFALVGPSLLPQPKSIHSLPEQSTIADTGRSKGFVVFLGWLGSHPRQVQRYESIWSKYGFECHYYVGSLDMQTFNTGRFTGFAKRILADINNFYASREVLPSDGMQTNAHLKQSTPTPRAPLYVHVFSLGGGFLLGRMNQLIAANPELYGNICINGIVYDSTPAHPELFGLGTALLTDLNVNLSKKLKVLGPVGTVLKYCVLAPAAASLPPALGLLAVYTFITREYWFIKDMMNIILWGGKDVKCDRLVKGVSSLNITGAPGSDLMCPTKYSHEFVQMRKEACRVLKQDFVESFEEVESGKVGKDTVLIVNKVFENSGHVLHFKTNKEEYTQLVQRFVDACNKLAGVV